MKGEWEPFFKHFASQTVNQAGNYITVEDFYQAIKERLKDELMTDTHGTSNYGLLVDRSSTAKPK